MLRPVRAQEAQAPPAESAGRGEIVFMAEVEGLLVRLRALEDDADAKNGQIVVLQQAVANLIRRVDQLESQNMPASSTKQSQGRAQVNESLNIRESKPHSSSLAHSPPNQDSRLSKPKFAGIEKPKRDSKRFSNVSRSVPSSERPASASIVRSRYQAKNCSRFLMCI